MVTYLVVLVGFSLVFGCIFMYIEYDTPEILFYMYTFKNKSNS